MPRRYVQRARAEAAERTRREVLLAARRALLERDELELNVGEIAAAAGVARSTVYAAFGSRARLLAELADDVLHGAGLQSVIDAAGHPNPVEALETSLRASCRMFGAEHRLFRRLRLLAEVDPDAAAPLARSNADRASGMQSLAERLAAQRRLRAGLSIAEAARVLGLLTSFAAFDELMAHGGLGPDDVAELLIRVAQTAVLSPAATGRSGA